MTLTKQSPCKVNLLLSILGKRADGFHELETVMQPVGLCEEITFERRTTGLELTCSDPALPCMGEPISRCIYDEPNSAYLQQTIFIARELNDFREVVQFPGIPSDGDIPGWNIDCSQEECLGWPFQ